MLDDGGAGGEIDDTLESTNTLEKGTHALVERAIPEYPREACSKRAN